MTNERGFTLVETLIAFATLAFAAVALYEAMGTSARGVGASSRFDEAVLIAEARMAEFAALDAMPAALEGAIEGTAYRWRIEPLAEETPESPELSVSPLRMQRIKLIVAWSEAGRSKEIAVERLLLVARRPGG